MSNNSNPNQDKGGDMSNKPSTTKAEDNHFLTVNELKGMFDDDKIIDCNARVFVRHRNREYVITNVSQFRICGDMTFSIKLSPDGQLFNPTEGNNE